MTEKGFATYVQQPILVRIPSSAAFHLVLSHDWGSIGVDVARSSDNEGYASYFMTDFVVTCKLLERWRWRYLLELG
jgi:hypothetical protein